MLQDGEVGFRPVEFAELLGREPADGLVLMRVRGSAVRGKFGEVGVHLYANLIVVMHKEGQLLEVFNGAAQLLTYLPDERRLAGLPRLHLAAGEFPFESKVFSLGTLGRQILAFVLNAGGYDEEGWALAHTPVIGFVRISATLIVLPGFEGRQSTAMKTALKIFLIVLIALLVIKLAPLLLVPAGFVFLLCLVVGGTVAAVLLGCCAGAVGLVVALLVAALALVAALSPLWVPVLMVLGLIALCRRLGGKARTA